MKDELLHPLEIYLLDVFQIDRDELYRLALFVLGHAIVDRHMIAAIAFDMARGDTDEAKIDHALQKASADTFGAHLGKAQRMGLLPEQCSEIAEKLNLAKNAFLHWQPRRYSLPQYNGQPITSDEGMETCFMDILRFLSTVPFSLDARTWIEDRL